MTIGLRDAALRWLRGAGRTGPAGRRGVVVEIVEARGSVPRGVGTRMLVGADEVLGTIGGGHLEWQAIARARALAVSGAAADEQQVVALGPTLGQCCGGSLTLRYRPLAAADPASWPEPAPRFTLQLYGAGHVGRAIARLLAGVECRVQWIDEREAEFPPDATSWLPPHIERLCAEPVEAEVAQAPPGCRYLVLTHSHALDLALAEAILRRGDFGWFGLIGSRSKRARFEHRLTERGFDPALIARIVCPIGLPGIAGKEPEVIAIAVVAQLLQCSETERQYGPVPA